MSVNTAWMDRALCVGADPDTWFESRLREEAQRVCGQCPVVAECQAAGADEYRGVWGGEPHMRKKVGPSPSAEYIGYQHGTDAGYSRHLREGTPPCGSCSVAHTFGNREWQERNSRVRTPEQLAEQKRRRKERSEPIRQRRSRVGVAGDLRSVLASSLDDLGALA